MEEKMRKILQDISCVNAAFINSTEGGLELVVLVQNYTRQNHLAVFKRREELSKLFSDSLSLHILGDSQEARESLGQGSYSSVYIRKSLISISA